MYSLSRIDSDSVHTVRASVIHPITTSMIARMNQLPPEPLVTSATMRKPGTAIMKWITQRMMRSDQPPK